MSKLIKFIFVLTLLFIIVSSYSHVFAVSSTDSTNTDTTEVSANSGTTSSIFSSTVTTSDFDLELTNILSICLIVVGVLLILLGIAILIRLKK